MPRKKGYNHFPKPMTKVTKAGKPVDPATAFGSMANPLRGGTAEGDNLPISRGTVTKNLHVDTGRTGASSAKQPGQFKFDEPFVDPAGKK